MQQAFNFAAPPASMYPEDVVTLSALLAQRLRLPRCPRCEYFHDPEKFCPRDPAAIAAGDGRRADSGAAPDPSKRQGRRRPGGS